MNEVNNSAVIKIIAERDREFKELNAKYLVVCGKLSDSINDRTDLKLENDEFRKLLKEAQKDRRTAQREIEKERDKVQELLDEMIREHDSFEEDI